MRILVALLLAGASLTASAADFYKIDPTHSFPHFAISHLGFSTTYGRFNQTNGRLMIDRRNNNGFVEVEIAAVSVDTGYGKRDDHLRSPDFLNVMEHPHIVYKSSNVTLIGSDQAKIEGELTLLGVTKPAALNVSRIQCGRNPINKKQTCGFEATAQIKRSDFGSTYGAPGIGDDIKLWFQIEAIKQD